MSESVALNARPTRVWGLANGPVHCLEVSGEMGRCRLLGGFPPRRNSRGKERKSSEFLTKRGGSLHLGQAPAEACPCSEHQQECSRSGHYRAKMLRRSEKLGARTKFAEVRS